MDDTNVIVTRSLVRLAILKSKCKIETYNRVVDVQMVMSTDGWGDYSAIEPHFAH